MHVAQLLHPLLRRPHIEIVEACLPESPRRFLAKLALVRKLEPPVHPQFQLGKEKNNSERPATRPLGQGASALQAFYFRIHTFAIVQENHTNISLFVRDHMHHQPLTNGIVVRRLPMQNEDGV